MTTRTTATTTMENNNLSPADRVLLELLHAAQESCAATNASASASSSTNANLLATIRSIVVKALSEPDLFYGYQQLQRVIQSAVAGTAGTEGERLMQTLNLFSYGTYTMYAQNPSLYLRLTDAQIYKLRQLTTMSLVQQKMSASTNKTMARIPYTELERALGFPSSTTTTNTAASAASPSSSSCMSDENATTANTSNGTTATTASTSTNSTRQVEEIVTSCLYAGVITGKLCQKTKSFVVTSVPANVTSTEAATATAADAMIYLAPPQRDVNTTTDIETMLQQIRRLQAACRDSHAALQQEQAAWTHNHEASEMAHWRLAQQLHNQSQADNSKKGGRGGSNMSSPAMVGGDLGTGAGAVGGGGSNRRQKRSRGGFGGGGGGGKSMTDHAFGGGRL